MSKKQTVGNVLKYGRNEKNDQILELKKEFYRYSEMITCRRMVIESMEIKYITKSIIEHAIKKSHSQYSNMMEWLIVFDERKDKNHVKLNQKFNEVCFNTKAIFDGNLKYFEYIKEEIEKDEDGYQNAK